MRLIDCCIFCDTYEMDLLFLKLYHESPLVDEFIISEAWHNYRGEYKGPRVAQAIAADERFAPYRDRITIISIEKNLSCSDAHLKGLIDPPEFAHAEWQLRDAPMGYLLKKYDDNDRVLTSDVDEFFDFIDAERRDRFLGLTKKENPFQIDRVRFHWDYDIRAYREKGDCINPLYTVGHLRHGVARLRDKKWIGDLVDIGGRPMCFEYCCVFKSRDACYRKFHSSLHTQWSNRLIDDAVNTCTWPRTTYQGPPDPNCKYHWFERVELSDDNSPEYVRDNFKSLSTGLVPADYPERRLAKYGVAGYVGR